MRERCEREVKTTRQPFVNLRLFLLAVIRSEVNDQADLHDRFIHAENETQLASLRTFCRLESSTNIGPDVIELEWNSEVHASCRARRSS